MIRFILLTILALPGFSLLSHAQSVGKIDSVLLNFQRFSAFQSPEKLYLHTDKQLYCSGEYIWFNAYLKNSSAHSLLPESNYVYAELMGRDSLLSRVMIKRSDEGFPGRIALASDLPSGKYTLRAYTAWMQPSPDAYMFHKEITVVNPLDEGGDILTPPPAQDDALFDIQFLPESGRYIPDDKAVLAFKALNTDGRGLGIKGAVYNSLDSLVCSFADSYKGMGKLEFYPVPNETYYALVRNEQGVEIKQALPTLSETGAVIHVRAQDGKRHIQAIVSESLLAKPLFLALSNGSEVFLCNSIEERKHEVALEEVWLSNGISHASIVDENGQVYAQRIFFTYYPLDAIEADILTNTPDPGKREKVSYTIQMLDKLQNGVQSRFSISVTDSYLVPHNDSEHMLSYMLLSSELHGVIENPSAFFDPAWRERDEALDLVMLTHGWRYYDMPAIFSGTALSPLAEKQYAQSISGKASSLFNRVSKSDIIVYAPSINLSSFAPMDRTGLFQIRNLDFSDSTQFVLSCTGKRGSTEYYLEVDQPIFPKAVPYPFLNNKNLISEPHLKNVVSEYALSYKEEKDDGLSISLDEAVVTANYYFVKPVINPSPFNQAFETRQIREREQMAVFDGMFLIDYLLASFGWIVNGGDENGQRRIRSVAEFSTSHDNEPDVYIDQMKMESTSDLAHIYVSDVENVVVLRTAEAGALYNSPGGVILISTRRHRDASQEKKIINTRLVSPLGWQKPSQFYTPNYSLKSDHDAVTYDNRSTLYWNPFVQTDENGVAEVSFYTSDRKTRYRFSIEGITHDGEYVSALKTL
jgi:Large extracellular alpha-helical protein